MDFLEKDLEDIIYDSLINDYDCLIERGFHNSFEYSYEEQNLRGFRQVNYPPTAKLMSGLSLPLCKKDNGFGYVKNKKRKNIMF